MVPGIIRKKLSRGPATDAVASELAANDSPRRARRPALAGASQNRGGSPRHPGLDVLQHHVLDAVRPLRRTLQL